MLQRKPSLHETHPLSSRGPSKQKGCLRSNHEDDRKWLSECRPNRPWFSPLAFLIFQQFWQIVDRAVKKRNVMKSIMHDCLRDHARLSAVGADDKDAGVVIGHRQSRDGVPH
jgi:hypothetical protein